MACCLPHQHLLLVLAAWTWHRAVMWIVTTACLCGDHREDLAGCQPIFPAWHSHHGPRSLSLQLSFLGGP